MRSLSAPVNSGMDRGDRSEIEDDQERVWLERAYEEHESTLYALRAEPLCDPFCSDPRFQDLLRRIGFPEG